MNKESIEGTATFEIETSFKITGRGIVALGTFTEGMTKLGAKATVVVNNEPTIVTVAGIDWGKPNVEGIIKWGLLLRFADDKCREYVQQNRLLPQKIVTEHPLT